MSFWTLEYFDLIGYVHQGSFEGKLADAVDRMFKQ